MSPYFWCLSVYHIAWGFPLFGTSRDLYCFISSSLRFVKIWVLVGSSASVEIPSSGSLLPLCACVRVRECVFLAMICESIDRLKLIIENSLMLGLVGLNWIEALELWCWGLGMLQNFCFIGCWMFKHNSYFNIISLACENRSFGFSGDSSFNVSACGLMF